MKATFDSSWENILKDELAQPYFRSLTDFVDSEYKSTPCYPPEEQIFAAFNACDFKNLKVVIIGQDPYHGSNQANGLCFSVNKGVSFPPSLTNIFKEIHTDLGQAIPTDGDLFRWAKQGVLLLNATLTVRAGQAGSHQKQGWEKFTDAVIKSISKEKEEVVFLLWGGFAKGKVKLINQDKHFILTSGHPSPLSANRGYWFGNKHFSKCNEYLIKKGHQPIEW